VVEEARDRSMIIKFEYRSMKWDEEIELAKKERLDSIK